jgi:hypothetical protein
MTLEAAALPSPGSSRMTCSAKCDSASLAGDLRGRVVSSSQPSGPLSSPSGRARRPHRTIKQVSERPTSPVWSSLCYRSDDALLLSMASILRSAQFLRSATVKLARNGFAVTIISRVVRPVESAFAIVVAASA